MRQGSNPSQKCCHGLCALQEHGEQREPLGQHDVQHELQEQGVGHELRVLVYQKYCCHVLHAQREHGGQHVPLVQHVLQHALQEHGE